jgi:2-polyprenyl-3-methyl-5-hydroxy-6-metoxy-1,4-benzoquinol methylase
MNISPTGFWDYNNSNHNESIHFDLGLSKFLLNFITINKLDTIFDFGCSTGYYLNFLNQNLPNLDLLGIEPMIDKRSDLFFDKILNYDLSKPFDLNKNGSIICLEVLEHIPSNLENYVIDNIINHCTGYLFISWARPNQGGFGHIHEKSLEYVINLFTSI